MNCWRKTGCPFNSNNSHKYLKCLQDEYSIEQCESDNEEKFVIEELENSLWTQFIKEEKEIKLEQTVKNSLQIIFKEINKIKNVTYSKIKHKHLDNITDIWEAIGDTKLYEYLKKFEIPGRQYDVDIIIKGIQKYIDYEIESLVEKDQWQ